MQSNPPPEFTLLMTCVGGELAAQAVLLMKRSQRFRIRVVGVDASVDSVGRYFVDSFHVVPRGDAPNYVEEIARVAGSTGTQLILPASDEEAIALAGRRSLVERDGCKLACTDVETIRTMASKAATYRWLERHGFAVPRWHVVGSVPDLESRLAALLSEFGEAVVKPSEARGGRGAIVVRSDIQGAQPQPGTREIHADPHTFRTQMLSDYAQHLPAIVMQRLREPVHDLDLLGWQGRPLRVVPRRRLDSRRPNEGHVFVGNEELLILGRKLIAELRLSWLYDCDVMYDGSGTPYVVEMNPRPSGSVSVTATAGVPLFDDLVALARGEDVPEHQLPLGRVVVPYRALHTSSA